jgi:predicted MPP superfamily phosphohydrolase
VGPAAIRGRSAIQLGAVVEMLHAATLVHDDVIDAAETRRGRPSTNVKWGNHTCVLAGDWLYMQAFQIALRERNFHDSRSADRPHPDDGGRRTAAARPHRPHRYHRSRLHGAGGPQDGLPVFGVRRLGAVAATPIRRPRSAGRVRLEPRHGVPVVDDVLDFTAREKTLGKPVGGDLREGKVTLPLVYALERATPAERRLVETMLILALVERYRGIDRVKRAQTFTERARQVMRRVSRIGLSAGSDGRDRSGYGARPLILAGLRALALLALGRKELASPPRRDFLRQTANVVTAAPFVGGAYGLFYGRLNLETVERPIHLANLPTAFQGFRIAQLSDIHIGPFMTGEQIRKFAAIANALKPDLIVLTGDFVTFDAGTERPVVEALSGLHAPFGVYGCLGNHDTWAGVEDSITSLFAAARFRILRGASAPISVGGDWFNLIGVDFQSRHRFGSSPAVPRLLGNIESLIARGQVNILLSHNPDTFDRAAALGIDLSMAGHTHGGQAALEFISPEIAPTRLVTPYVAGLFQKPGGQLYVNRGIGTIGMPIRIGAPPEITVYRLERA